MLFQERPVWLKAAFILTSIGFVVWLSASQTLIITDMKQEDAYVAFLIIGLLAYYTGLVVTFTCTFLDVAEGNNIVLLIGAGWLFLAGISGLISASISRVVTHSDRLGWALVCALTSGAFLILNVFAGGRGSSGHSSAGRGGGGGGGNNGTSQQHAEAPPISDWRTGGGAHP